MSETLADRLALAATQLSVTSERISRLGVTADDMQALGSYLEALAEHGHHVCALALNAVDRTASDHPVRAAPHGIDLQAAVAHAKDMFGAAIHFAFEVEQAADAMTEGEATS